MGNPSLKFFYFDCNQSKKMRPMSCHDAPNKIQAGILIMDMLKKTAAQGTARPLSLTMKTTQCGFAAKISAAVSPAGLWRRCLLLPLLASAMGFLGSQPLGALAADATGKIKLLIIEGASNHDWEHRLELVKGILAKDGSFDVDVSITPSRPDDPALQSWRPDFSKYDVVLSGYNNYFGHQASWPAEVQTAFCNFVTNGGGFYCYHEAENSFPDWPEYNRMIGLGWRKADYGRAVIVTTNETLQFVPPGKGGNTGHISRPDVVVHQLGEHPIHRGLPREWMAAELEIYHYARGPAENLTVLSYAKEAQSQLQFPIEWMVQYGKGHVFMSTYGHCWANDKVTKGMKCAAFQTIMVRALKWLAHRDPGDACPPDFPTPDKISLRQ